MTHVRNVRIWLPVLLIVMLALAACSDDTDDSAVDENPEPTATEEPAEPADSEEEEDMQQPSMQWDQPPAMQLEDGTDYQAVLKTNRGEIVVNLLEGEAPATVNNFVFLAEQGFYQNVPFHRVISGFMIQTGDPTGTGAGGPGYRFDDEPVTRDYVPGTVAMANAGPNTNGSQFFIVHADLRNRLPKDYTIFGEVVEGMDVVDEIANVQVQPSRTGEMSSPTEEVQINSVEIRKQ
jgi:cyclophilin family peptidyl-prolyl cis-trans isomerase